MAPWGFFDVSDSQTTPPNDATDSTAQTAVGTLLRENRERAGLVIADVARVLRISQKYLEALEDGRNADLPGTPYAIGFVRSYAEHLHLDGEEIVRRYKNEAEGLAGKTDLVFPKPIPDGGVPGAAVLGLGVIVAAVAYGVWYWNSSQNDVEIARVEAVPEHMAVAKDANPEPVAELAPKSVPEPAPKSAPEPTPETVAEPEAAVETSSAFEETVVQSAEESAQMVEKAAEQVADAEKMIEPTTDAVEGEAETAAAKVEEAVENGVVPAQDVVAETPEVSEEAPPQVSDATTTATQAAELIQEKTEVASVPTTAPAVDITPRNNVGPSRITVRAKSNSWIQVRDEVADRLLFTRLLREGDEYDVPNRSGLRLMTGNAGALELLVDGNVAPAIGKVGEVRRNVELDADKLKSGFAASE